MSGGTGNIGVIIRECFYGQTISFYGKLFEMVLKALYDNQYYDILELLSEDNEKNGIIPRVMQDKKVDGLIFLGQIDGDYAVKMIAQTELPVFFLDTYIPSVNIDTVISDGYYGTYTLTNYLIQQGHRKIGFVGSVEATCSIADRFWGYRRALRENGIPFEERWEIPDRNEPGRTYGTILSTPGDMNAFVCNCDYTAFQLIKNLEDAGYSVPEDVSVVGFDNYLPQGMDPADRITSYEVDMDHMAHKCVKSLIRKIQNKKYTRGIQIVTGKIVYKNTVKAR